MIRGPSSRNWPGATLRVRAIRLRRNFGKAAALSAGFAEAKGGIVLTLDADGQDDPAEVPRFLEALDTGLDVVSGWKKARRDPWHKVGPSRLFNRAVSRLTGCRLHDHNCGFKAYRRDGDRRGRNLRRTPPLHPRAGPRPGVPRGGDRRASPPPGLREVQIRSGTAGQGVPRSVDRPISHAIPAKPPACAGVDGPDPPARRRRGAGLSRRMLGGGGSADPRPAVARVFGRRPWAWGRSS